MADRIARVVSERLRGRSLPVRVHLPNGHPIALADEPRVDLYLRDWSAARTLAGPTLGALARAYVHDRLDFSGGARQVLELAEALVGSIRHGGDSIGARLRFLSHRLRGNQANIRHHYDVSNAFYRMWLDSRMVYSCA